jgi:hypothetical protein
MLQKKGFLTVALISATIPLAGCVNARMQSGLQSLMGQPITIPFTHITTKLYFIVFWLMLPIVGIYLILISKFMSRMRDAHDEEYRRLGEPSLISNNTPVTTFRLVKFIALGSYKALGDSRLNALGIACTVLLVLSSILFVILIISQPAAL